MHNNYYFLRQLSQSLEKILTGTVISECFSQNKDELIIRFETATVPFFIKASLLPSFACLSFPEEFHRARKNSVDLFSGVIGHRIRGIRQFKNERSFALLLSDHTALLFKMHGNRSNIILFEEDAAVELFKNNIPADVNLKLETLDRAIDWSKETFITNQHKLQAVYFTFGKIIWHYLEALQFTTKTTEEKWQMIQQILETLNHPKFFITEIHGSIHLSLINFGNIHKEYSNPLDALNKFFQTYTHEFAFVKEKTFALSTLNDQLKSSTLYYEKTFSKLAEIQRNTSYKTWADLIMANLHTINPGAEIITLPDFYNNNQLVEIKLKKELSPQKNAEVYYRKAKNQHIEIERLTKALTIKKKEIEILKSNHEKVQSAEDLTSIRTVVGESALNLKKVKSQVEPLPYFEFEHKGFKIWVGRNAKSNDVLTLKYGYKEDLWLHAKDVAGSHVLIKHQAGKNFPKDVIERAAQLAAYNSKRKNESLCPVIFTPKKYVRKRKGDPAGAVIVEREEIILVEPKKDNL